MDVIRFDTLEYKATDFVSPKLISMGETKSIPNYCRLIGTQREKIIKVNGLIIDMCISNISNEHSIQDERNAINNYI